MKKLLSLLLVALLLAGCAPAKASAQVAATTLPVYEFTLRLCEGADISVTRLVTENVSCLHDYSLQVEQLQKVAAAQVVILSGCGLEDFLEDVLTGAADVIDASQGVPLLPGEDGGADPHIWLSPGNAEIMAQNICDGLCQRFPAHASTIRANLESLLTDLSALQAYGEAALAELPCRQIITFHDGFAYFAQAFDLHILKAVEEESGSEAAASDLIELIDLVNRYQLPAIFAEANGSTAAAQIICGETGASVAVLDMAMSGDSYFTAMYHNIDTIREAYS